MLFFFFNDTATTEIYTLSLHDALPISAAELLLGHRHELLHGGREDAGRPPALGEAGQGGRRHQPQVAVAAHPLADLRSEEHTSELQSRQYLVCRLLLEKKKKKIAN